MMKKWLILLFFPTLLLADKAIVPVESSYVVDAPWFTGPLLASAPTVVPIGHFGTEPYFTYSNVPARYNNDWKAKSNPTLQQVIFTPYIWVGLTSWADIQLVPQWSWEHRPVHSQWVINDCSAKLEIQIHRDQIPHKSWLPNIKIGVQETFPTGKYERLNPRKQLTDQGGLGSWTTTFQLAMGKIFQVKERHWLQVRLNLNYAFSTPVHVRGLNAYGGSKKTDGTVRPGQQFYFDFAWEYSLTRHWVLACDFVGSYQGSSPFSGDPGHNPDGSLTSITPRASIQYSIAPALEYNWSESLGIIAGAWVTLAGKNSNKFCNGIIALNYYR